MKVWRSRALDRLPWFVCKKLDLNTKSPRLRVDAEPARECFGWGVGKSLASRCPQTGHSFIRRFFSAAERFRRSAAVEITTRVRLQASSPSG